MFKGCVARKVAPSLYMVRSYLVTCKRKQQSWLLHRRLCTLNNNYFFLEWELLFLTNEVVKWKEMIGFLESQLSCIKCYIEIEKPSYGQNFQRLIDDYNEQLNENNVVISILKNRPRVSPFPVYLYDEVYSRTKLAIAELDSLIIISFISLVFLWVSIEI
ncbi:Csm4p [Saccharomyces eubayanus]|uniref:Csm4p n=1 Tax=Saccharomyces eubayanus TaxID=1080349 RepID=UPI0006C48944|nr:CSM4-like protein [Saccharomyces eubayanus]KOG96121.1 CSM4-like protein [Saccharomyces eubayanus]